jgi:hypothetical protein
VHLLKTRKELVTSAQRGPAQTKKKEKLGRFSGSKPSGLSPQRALFKFREALDVLIMTSPLRVLKDALPLRVFKEARPLRVFNLPDFGPFGTECGSHN